MYYSTRAPRGKDVREYARLFEASHAADPKQQALMSDLYTAFANSNGAERRKLWRVVYQIARAVRRRRKWKDRVEDKAIASDLLGRAKVKRAAASPASREDGRGA